MTKTATKVSETIDLTAIEANLRPRSTEDLRFHFHECYAGAANFIAEAAVCVKLLQERGDNLTGIPLVGTFRRIAAGQILPELVWKFIESPNRPLVERLPLDDQKRIARDPMVPVAEAKPEGGFTKRMVDLTKAPADVAKLVAGPDGIRTLEEQMAHLGAQKARPVTKKPIEQEDEIQEPLSHSITIKLTESEWKAIRLYAAQNGCTEREAARTFLIRSTLFKPVKL